MNGILNPYDFRTMNLKLNNHKGYEVYRVIMSYRSSLSIFNQNFLDLKKLLSTPDILNLLDENSIRRWRKQRNIQKCLFNTITSGLAYTDHVREKRKQEIVPNTSRYINENTPILCFFRSLRNFIVHDNSFDLITVYRADVTFQSLKKVNFENHLIEQTSNPKRMWDKIALNYMQNMDDKEDIMIHLERYRDYIHSIHKEITINSIKAHWVEIVDFRDIFRQTTNFQDIQYPLNLVQLRHLDILLESAQNLNYLHES